MGFKIPNIFMKRKTATRQYLYNGVRYNEFAGASITPETSKKVAAYYRGLIYISTQIAKLPYEIKNKKNEVQDEHPIAILMNLAPNDFMTSFDFKVFIVQQAINYGNGYAEIERDVLGRPIALHPLRATTVQPMFVEEKLWYRVCDGLAPNADSYIPSKDMFVLKNFSTDAGFSGIGLAEYASNVLGISLGADQMAGNLYNNGGMPSGALTTAGELTDEQFERLKSSWNSAHTGKRSGGTAILEEGVSFSPISFSPDILQFLESRKFGVLEIARFLGLPPTKLFDGDSATYNNIEHANLEVATDTLDAWSRSVENESDVKLLNKRKGGLKTELDIYAVFRGDMETRSNYFNKMMQNGAMTSNEIRLKEGLSPYEGGDRYYIATNNFTPIDRMDEVIDSQVAPKTEDKSKEEIQTEKDLNEAALALLKKN
tara:strand:- start:1504 stop:2790 length:1287 start_codon:yes stop_codon:yes gene_type:complete